MSDIVHVSDDSFESDVLKSDVPVLVDYWADWCGPCKMIAPILEEIAGEYDGKVKITKLNIKLKNIILIFGPITFGM